MSPTTLNAWEMAAGVSASKASLTVRTLLLVAVFIWAVWCLYSELHYYRHHGVDLYDVLRKNGRVLLVVSVAVALVYLG